jgi:hypothetical protein
MVAACFPSTTMNAELHLTASPNKALARTVQVTKLQVLAVVFDCLFCECFEVLWASV